MTSHAHPRRGRGYVAAALGVFALLLASYAYYWQSRDWNTASRLMLTYAIADRGTIRLDGLDQQTRDIAFLEGHYYTDKLPGLSFVAVPPYLAARATVGLERHPLGRPGMTHWPADYWATLGTSGLATAGLGACVVIAAGWLGCSPRGAALLGIGYGLGTPAYVYGTLAYGHQATALFLMLGMMCLWKWRGGGISSRYGLAGLFAALACLVELQAAPAAGVLGVVAVGQGIAARKASGPLLFVVGGIPVGLVLGAYNLLAFGSPFDMGYFHHATAQFAEVHSADNPLGLRGMEWSRAIDLIWGGYRGLLFYAPLMVLAPFGWGAMVVGKKWVPAVATAGVCLAFFAVNLSYPEWTGGWSTGPRLLVPLIPFGVVAGAAAVGRWGKVGWWVAMAATIAGVALMSLFVGVGGRIPQDIGDPLRDSVLPAWAGRPARGWLVGDPFARNLVQVWFPRWVGSLGREERGAQFVPLWVFQVVAAVGLLAVLSGRKPAQGLGEGMGGGAALTSG